MPSINTPFATSSLVIEADANANFDDEKLKEAIRKEEQVSVR
jgi:hypothetical protein